MEFYKTNKKKSPIILIVGHGLRSSGDTENKTRTSSILCITTENGKEGMHVFLKTSTDKLNAQIQHDKFYRQFPVLAH